MVPLRQKGLSDTMKIQIGKMLFVVLSILLFIENSAFAASNQVKSISVDLFIAACGKKESQNNDNAIGDKHLKDHAYGFLQIRQPCLDDVNRAFGTKLKAEQMLGNRPLSIWVCERYLSLYATRERLGREPSYEDMARIWNGGPCGAFDNGAVNKKGDQIKNPAARARLAQAQANAKRYSLSLRKILDAQMYAQR
jgi:hypothetical protein